MSSEVVQNCHRAGDIYPSSLSEIVFFQYEMTTIKNRFGHVTVLEHSIWSRDCSRTFDLVT
jgi:hypothetical protein